MAGCPMCRAMRGQPALLKEDETGRPFSNSLRSSDVAARGFFKGGP